MKLHLDEPISSKLFTWSAKNGTAEHSDLGRPNVFQQIFDDACDVGFAVKSEKTGKVETFYHYDVNYSGHGEDREIAGWKFYNQDRTVHITVINDD